MYPFRTSLLLAAPHFQIRNLPIANLHHRKKRLQNVRYFRASSGRICDQMFTACSASMDVSHIGSILVVSFEVRVQMMKIVRKQAFYLLLLQRMRHQNASIAYRIASIASQIASIASRIALIASLIASIALRTASDCVKCD